MRVALGVSRWRVIRPVLLEALLVTVGGASLGLAATFVASDALLAHVPPAAYGHAVPGVDARIGLESLVLGVAAGLLCAFLRLAACATLRPMTG